MKNSNGWQRFAELGISKHIGRSSLRTTNLHNCLYIYDRCEQLND